MYEKYKDKREMIYDTFLDVNNEMNSLREQRDLAWWLVKFLDMKTEVDSKSKTYELVEARLDKQIERKTLEADECKRAYQDRLVRGECNEKA